MGIKKVVKKALFNIASGINDVLYRRPYKDIEKKKRKSSKDTLLHLDLVITECCSLKCRDCSNLMQYYCKPENLKTEDVLSDLTKLLSAVRVEELKILGGEPFVNQKGLLAVLEFLAGSEGNKVGKINIITNGTIIPGEDVLEAIKREPKAYITFSNYGKLSAKQDEFILICKDLGISYVVLDEDFYWLDFGRVSEYKESDEFVQRQYKNCYNRKNCMTLYKGRLYVCPRQAHGTSLGLIPDTEGDFVALDKPEVELKKAVIGLVNRQYPITACRYCINGKYIHIPRGVQEKRKTL
ncbi:MAG: radical SAM protein [Saccharofermentans sp.]|nr:radical SAM protein [Saccharofermentans sp.]